MPAKLLQKSRCSPSWYHRWRKPLQLLSCSTNFLTSKISVPDLCAALFVSWSLWFYTLFYAEWHLLRGKSTHNVLSWPKKSLGIFFFTLLNLYWHFFFPPGILFLNFGNIKKIETIYIYIIHIYIYTHTLHAIMEQKWDKLLLQTNIFLCYKTSANCLSRADNVLLSDNVLITEWRSIIVN